MRNSLRALVGAAALALSITTVPHAQQPQPVDAQGKVTGAILEQQGPQGPQRIPLERK